MVLFLFWLLLLLINYLSFFYLWVLCWFFSFLHHALHVFSFQIERPLHVYIKSYIWILLFNKISLRLLPLNFSFFLSDLLRCLFVIVLVIEHVGVSFIKLLLLLTDLVDITFYIHFNFNFASGEHLQILRDELSH